MPMNSSAVSCCMFCLLVSYASATSACWPIATVTHCSISAASTCRQAYPSRLAMPAVTLAWLSSVNTAIAALCGWLRFSLLRDSPSGCSYLNRRIPHDQDLLRPALSNLLWLFLSKQKCVPMDEFSERHELSRF